MIPEPRKICQANSPEQVEKTALFIEKMNSNAAYLSIPTRPPAVKEVKFATEKDLTISLNRISNDNDNPRFLLQLKPGL